MTDIMLKGARKLLLAWQVVALKTWSAEIPSQAFCEPIGVHREFFIVGRFLFVYFIFYGKDA